MNLMNYNSNLIDKVTRCMETVKPAPKESLIPKRWASIKPWDAEAFILNCIINAAGEALGDEASWDNPDTCRAVEYLSAISCALLRMGTGWMGLADALDYRLAGVDKWLGRANEDGR